MRVLLFCQRVCYLQVHRDPPDAFQFTLLLSKTAMKRARTHLDFETDTVTMLGRRLKLQCTSSGHYFVPIAKPSLDKNGIDHIVLFVKDVESKSTKEKAKIVEKLHKQFSHPSGKKLHDLAKDAGIKDPEFIEMLQNVPKSCVGNE